jgi:DNA-binding NtrC family response regulator
MQRLRRDAEKVAQSDAPVLVIGEIGTGKELLARVIHAQSARGGRAFVAVNCVSLAPSRVRVEDLLESARGGTLFFDDIDDLHVELQGQLVAFLHGLLLDVRLIAATHIDLEASIRRRAFREDLYYRLNVLRLRAPALREHLEDVEEMATACLGSDRRAFSPSALDALKAHDWPGNVRELVNCVQRARLMAEGAQIQPEDLGFESSLGEASLQLEDARDRVERQRILAALERSGWSARRSAQLVGVSRPTFYRLLKRHGLHRP